MDRPPSRDGGLGRRSMLVLLAVLGALVVVAIPGIGADPWAFEPGEVEPRGPLGWLVELADSEWDLALVRTSALFAGLLVAAAAAVALHVDRWRSWVAVALTTVVVLLLTVPGALLQVGLRDATSPWFFTNDSTYQTELAGELVTDGESPYGHDFRFSGLARFYSLDGTVTEETREEQLALRHFAYFPGAALSAAPWSVVPEPFDDYRVLVLLATLALVPAALLLQAPLAPALAGGAVLAANPLAARAVWFGVSDSVSLLAVVLAFAFVTRGSNGWGAAALAAAVLLKQFALVAVPFLTVMLLTRGLARRELGKVAAVFASVLLAGFFPFLVADPVAVWEDTVRFGAESYRIIGYGLAGVLVELGVIEDRMDPYPFALLAALVWAPVTAWLAWLQLRSRELWTGAAGFAISVFLLLYLSRVLQYSWLVWPLAGITLACLLALSQPPSSEARLADDDDRPRRGPHPDVARRVARRH